MRGPAMDGGRPIAPADDAADGDDGDIDQEVPEIARVARVVERFEVGAEGADVDDLSHERHPWMSRYRPADAEPRRAAIRSPRPGQGYRAEVLRARLLNPYIYARWPCIPNMPKKSSPGDGIIG